MIDAFSLETAHLFGDALPSAHRLRHRIFVRRRKYAVPSHRGMEWDQFDTPASVYMLWRDEATRVRAVARLIPTSQPYMIQQLWPHLVEGEMPMRDDVWEITRFGIDPDLDGERRARVSGELFCAFAEFGLKTGISAYIFVTPTAVIDSALGSTGLDIRRLGKAKRLGRLPVVAACSPVSYAALHRLRRHHGISAPVLRLAGEIEDPRGITVEPAARRCTNSELDRSSMTLHVAPNEQQGGVDVQQAALELVLRDRYLDGPDGAVDNGRRHADRGGVVAVAVGCG